MDGVLIEAKDWHYDALNKALQLFGMKISRYDHLVTYDGLPTISKLKILSTECGLPEKLHEFINDMKQLYTLEIIHAQCKPRFDHEYALSKLSKEGYLLAVASNSVRSSIEIMMKKASLERYLKFSLSRQDVKNGKPDAEIYIKAINKLGFFPSECLIIEDNEKGIVAAKGSGAWVMEVNDVDDVNYINIKRYIKMLEGNMS